MKTSLFEQQAPRSPLPHRVRPRRLKEVVAGDAVRGFLDRLEARITEGQTVLPNLVLEGPPGTGKTSIARALGAESGYVFRGIHGASDGVARIRECQREAEGLRASGRGLLLFVDEAHRLGRPALDSLLDGMETGLVCAVLATTEHSGFSLGEAILSRCQVVRLPPLERRHFDEIGRRATEHPEGIRVRWDDVPEDARRELFEHSLGDARRYLLLLEDVALAGEGKITHEAVAAYSRKRSNGQYGSRTAIYDSLSWLQKSVRNSDPSSTLLALARLIDGGVDPRIVTRRMLVIASEDVGMAHSTGLLIAHAAAEAMDRIGPPEGWIPVAHALTYLARAPKSNSAYAGMKEALRELRMGTPIEVPGAFRNAVTEEDRRRGAGIGYASPFGDDSEEAATGDGALLPEALKDRRFFRPSGRGEDTD